MIATRVGLFGLLILAAFNQAIGQVPTPDHAAKWENAGDDRNWEKAYQAGNSKRIIFEMVPEGQKIESWDEMLAQQIDFTDVGLEAFVENWSNELKQAARDIEIKVIERNEKTTTVYYKSVRFNEVSIRKFMKGNDGIYAFAYHARPTTLKEEMFELWQEHVKNSELIANPLKKDKLAIPFSERP